MGVRRLVPALAKGLRNLAGLHAKGYGAHQTRPREVGPDGSGHVPVAHDLTSIGEALDSVLGQSADIARRQLSIGSGAGHGVRALLVYVDGLIANDLMDLHFLAPIMRMPQGMADQIARAAPDDRPALLARRVVSVPTVAAVEWPDVVPRLLAGHIVLFLEGSGVALTAHLPGYEHRGVSTPQNEPVVKGPKDGFTETLRVNTSLIRRRIRDEGLRVMPTRVGRRTSTDVAIVYVAGLANPRIVESVTQRIEALDIDRLTDSNALQLQIEDAKWSPFPQVVGTERPDEAAGHLLEGRVIVLVDNSSTALILPVTLRNFLISGEDYSQRWPLTSFIRTLRGLSIVAGLLFPALYIALTAFHPELLPLKLLTSIGVSRLYVPLPSILEALTLSVSLEVLTEASVRLPGVMGPTIGVVGGLVIGQAAVNSGLVSAGMVIVLSLTAIGTFTIPKPEMAAAIRYLRFPLMVAAWAWGLFGVTVGALVIAMHLCELHSFGVPYTSPLAPLYVTDLQDDVFRLPHADETERSRTSQALDTRKSAGAQGRGEGS